MSQGKGDLAPQVGAGLPGDCECELTWFGPYLLDAPAQGQLGEACPVLDAPKPLFLDAGHQAAVGHRRGGRVGVEDRKADD
jgi:hypothetical protein